MDRSSSPESDPDAPFNVSASLAPPRDIKSAGTTTTTFDGLLQEPLLLKEDLKNGCGGQLWPAGMILSKYLLSQHSKDMAGKSVSVFPPNGFPLSQVKKPCGFSYILHPPGNLTTNTPCSVELGAGGGLVGLAVARGCEVGMPIHITDQIPMFELMKDNIALNNLDSNVVASILDWGEPVPSHIPSKPDIILAADCVYFEPAFPLLIATLHDLLGPNSVCYFCYKRRRRADLRFMKMAKKAFDVQEIRDDPNAASYSRESLYLYTIRVKPNKQATTVTQIAPPTQSTRSEAEKGQ